MTDQNALETLRDRPVQTDADVLALVRALLLPVVRRQCWLLFLGEDAVPVQVLVPIDDLPAAPEPDGVAQFAQAMGEIVPDVGATQVIVAWERPGSSAPRDRDRAWAEAVTVAFARAAVPLRAQVLVSDDGVALLPALGAVAA
ncbi:hypothetical protein DEI81_00540 [Curtobacterium sp. MCBD17_013]|uniref:hypothetical protein n=1 Tax=Curtobacterium sp. MCBD17_013 TaxID=2175668 RepID=UPI000DA9028A|nr:hypothetical protein [Curtobacterium sp. MCBD17_013]PZF66159.1 hypothetical protein DEI81_00540 [Curtobacterium sp. MCBD17_013]